MYGSRYNVPQVITKLGRAENSKFSADLPIGSVVCPSQLCCNTVVRYVRAMGHKNGAAVTIHSIADGHAEAMEFTIDENSLNRGIPLKKLKLKKNILLVSISRADATEIPNADSTYDIGDSVVIVVSGEDRILEFNDIFAPW
jgi:trk system potassium uptake protein TrkA